jgi:uncharacterized protein YkwD
MRRCVLIALIGLASLTLLNCSGGGKSKSSGPDAVTLLLLEINSHRSGNELQYDPLIAAVALAHGQWLDSQYTAAYQSTGSGGSTPTTRLQSAGITDFYGSAAETGCYTDQPAAATVYSMMNTSTLTNSTYTHIGIGRAPCTQAG